MNSCCKYCLRLIVILTTVFFSATAWGQNDLLTIQGSRAGLVQKCYSLHPATSHEAYLACEILGKMILTGTSGGQKDQALAREYFAKACEWGGANGCRLLGLMWAEGRGGPKEETKARCYFAKACDAGNADACAIAGSMWNRGDGGPEDHVKARDLFTKACGGGEGHGCYELGRMWEYGFGGPMNALKAVAFYKKACDWGDGDVCLTLGNMWFEGKKKQRYDANLARDVYSRACDSGNTNACYILSRTWVSSDLAREAFSKACGFGYNEACIKLGLMWASGEGGPKNDLVAQNLYAKVYDSCGGSGCAHFGEILNGENFKFVGLTDKVRARMFFSKACDSGYDGACVRLGLMLAGGEGGPKDALKARKIYARAYDSCVGPECTAMGEILAPSSWGPKDLVRAREFHMKACESGDSRGCRNLGSLTNDDVKRREFLTKACLLTSKRERDRTFACFMLAQLWQHGDGGRKDEVIANEIYAKGCELGMQALCKYSARFWVEGKGFINAPSRARKALTQCCELGNSECCVVLGQVMAVGECGPRDDVRARELYAKADELCANNGSCYSNLGEILHVNPKEPNDVVRSRDFFAEACGLGHADGCLGLGLMWANGEGGEKDDGTAREFYEKAYDLCEGYGCCKLGVKLLNERKGLEDEPHARELFAKGCESNDLEGCLRLGLMWANGDGGPKDEGEANKYFTNAYELCDSDCDWFGIIMQHGSAAPVVQSRARDFFGKACESGESEGCVRLGLMWANGDGGPKDEDEANKYFTNAYELCNSDCDWFGIIMQHGSAAPVVQSRARDFFGKACESGESEGCVRLGLMLADGLGGCRNQTRARKLFDRVYQLCGARDCYKLGIIFRSAYPPFEHDPRARDFFAKACELGHGLGCIQHSILMYPLNPDVARTDFDRFQAEAVVECKKDGEACLVLANWYLVTGDTPKEKDFRQKGYQLLQKSCDRGNVEHCLILSVGP